MSNERRFALIGHTHTGGGGGGGSVGIPLVTSAGETLNADRNGYCVATTGAITVPAHIFSGGNAVSIYNDTAAGIAITQGSGLTLRLAGTDATGSRSLSARGWATIWFRSATEAVISGAGLA